MPTKKKIKSRPGDWLMLGALGAMGLLMSQRKRTRPAGFRGQVVAITGGSRGLGLVLARQLAREGAHLAICARDHDELERAKHELEALGAQPVLARKCDISVKAEVTRWLTAVEKHVGPIDVLINNAGIIQVAPFDSLREEDLREIMEINFWGMVHTVLALAPKMRVRGRGKIVNIASIGGEVAVPHLLGYSAAKFSAVGFSRGITAELSRHGIRVTTVIPGLMKTGSEVNAYFKGRARAEFRWFALGARAPLLSMEAETAADRILAACRLGQPVVVLGLPARLARICDAVAPNLTSRLTAFVAGILPRAGEKSRAEPMRKGSEVGENGPDSARNNEVSGDEARPKAA